MIDSVALDQKSRRAAGIKRKFHARSPFTTKVMRSKSEGGHSGFVTPLMSDMLAIEVFNRPVELPLLEFKRYRCGNSAGFTPDFPQPTLYAIELRLSA